MIPEEYGGPSGYILYTLTMGEERTTLIDSKEKPASTITFPLLANKSRYLLNYAR
jgi:hypothetical protein